MRHDQQLAGKGMALQVPWGVTTRSPPVWVWGPRRVCVGCLQAPDGLACWPQPASHMQQAPCPCPFAAPPVHQVVAGAEVCAGWEVGGRKTLSVPLLTCSWFLVLLKWAAPALLCVFVCVLPSCVVWRSGCLCAPACSQAQPGRRHCSSILGDDQQKPWLAVQQWGVQCSAARGAVRPKPSRSRVWGSRRVCVTSRQQPLPC